MERALAIYSWTEADALFAAALEMLSTAREELLRLECAGRPDLRRRVEELLCAAVAAESCFEGIPEFIGHTLEQAISERAVDSPQDGDGAAQPAERRIGRYRLARRLARGGMGTVYLAERADGAFERLVALKLLRRGLDTDDILARFRAERQILADLEHPNIARLIDGGSTTDGRPYLVMEYVRGVPITDYCDRHGVSLQERLRLVQAVCAAVHHAHLHGVIHRDLKPANILVDEQGTAKLLDFGIARLLGSESEAVRTRTGVRLMTPDYASPEQVLGEEVTEASDVYQIGLLLYELLCGVRPYRVNSRSVTDIERVVCREPVAPPSARVPRRVRRRLRGNLDAITLKALRKEPAGRYPSAKSLSLDLEGHLERRPVTARSESRGYRIRYHIRRHRARLLIGAGAAAVALVVLAVMPRLGPPLAPTPPPGAVAVLPFRVSGADASLSYLREGMVDLLSTKLTGEGGLRAIAPATVLAGWQSVGGSGDRDLPESGALELARRVGAEQLLIGEVVGTPASMILSAALLTVPEGRIDARATVQGPADSILFIVDQLTARLLILAAGEDHRPLGVLATMSLPALRAYLEGRVAFRAARYQDAYDRFSEAVEIDSTFALAAVYAYRAAWFSPRIGSARMLELAWRGRERLDDRDRAIVTTALGPDYPAPYPQAERLLARRRLLDMSPDRVELRYMYADRLYHWHALLELWDGRELAAAQFRRALEADSSYAPAYQHLVPLLYSLNEAEEAKRLEQAYLRREPTGGIRSFLSWRAAAAEGDTAMLAGIRAGLDTLADGELLQILRAAIQDAVEVEDAERVMAVLRTRGLTPSTHRRVLRENFILQLLRGRPTDAAAAAERLRDSQLHDNEIPRLEAHSALVLTALYGDGDSAAASAALESLSASAFGSGDTPRPEARLADLCTVAQWRLWNGESRSVRGAIQRLRAADTRAPLKDTGPVCAVLLEAIESTLRGQSDAAQRLARLDSILATGPDALFTALVLPANLAAARLNERLGKPRQALTAVRRRVYDFDSSNLLLATSLRLEGRLAAQTGDREGAIRAYRHYLALRSDPEPTLRAQVDSVRTALAALEKT